jgi:hypothetical protein
MSEENRLIDEESAKKVLSRAIELDEAKRDALSAEQLRAVARDMSISTSSIDQALEEQRLAHEPPTLTPAPARRFGRSFSVPLVVVIAILALFAIVASTRIVVPPHP